MRTAPTAIRAAVGIRIAMSKFRFFINPRQSLRLLPASTFKLTPDAPPPCPKFKTVGHADRRSCSWAIINLMMRWPAQLVSLAAFVRFHTWIYIAGTGTADVLVESITSHSSRTAWPVRARTVANSKPHRDVPMAGLLISLNREREVSSSTAHSCPMALKRGQILR